MKKNNRQIQKERDAKIIDFISHFQCATTDTLHQLFFIKEDGTHTTLRMTQNRLERLVKYNQIRRDREYVSQQYYYYLPGKKPTSQLRHSLLITDFYRELYRLDNTKIHRFFKVTTGDFRPDAMIAFTINESRLIVAYLEVEISNKGFDMDKYIDYKNMEAYKEIGFNEMPKLIIIGNKKNIHLAEGIEIIKIKEDLSNIKQLLKLGNG